MAKALQRAQPDQWQQQLLPADCFPPALIKAAPSTVLPLWRPATPWVLWSPVLQRAPAVSFPEFFSHCFRKPADKLHFRQFYQISIQTRPQKSYCALVSSVYLSLSRPPLPLSFAAARPRMAPQAPWPQQWRSLSQAAAQTNLCALPPLLSRMSLDSSVIRSPAE